MKILAIDSCTSSCGAAIADEGHLLAVSTLDCGLNHSKTLLCQVDAVLSGTASTLNDMDYIAVTVGPGSFTGIRIGVATAKGLAQACHKGVIPVPTLEALAYNLPPSGALTVCALDARRAQVYCAVFDSASGRPERLTPDRAISIDELGDELVRLGRRAVFVGDGAKLCADRLAGRLDCAAAPDNLICSTAASAVLAARETAFACNFRPISPEALTPVYLRRPQAERERLERLESEEKI